MVNAHNKKQRKAQVNHNRKLFFTKLTGNLSRRHDIQISYRGGLYLGDLVLRYAVLDKGRSRHFPRKLIKALLGIQEVDVAVDFVDGPCQAVHGVAAHPIWCLGIGLDKGLRLENSQPPLDVLLLGPKVGDRVARHENTRVH